MKKRVLIKLSGEIMSGCVPLIHPDSGASVRLNNIIDQIKGLQPSYDIGIVIGGGNIFRASKEGKALAINQQGADQAGMLATVINGIVLRDKLEAVGVGTTMLSAIPVPSVAQPVQEAAIKMALQKGHCLVFVGGTGNPFFTTDTCAILRALQMHATELWKATKEDFIYDADPRTTTACKALKSVTYQEVLDKKLGIIDSTAITLAQQHRMPIRVFNVFKENALITASKDSSLGSVIHT